MWSRALRRAPSGRREGEGMRYVVSGRLREPSGLSPAEYFALAVREWEVVLDWLHARKALGYGRLGGAGGAILVDAASEAEARALARSLPFAPYAEMWVTPAKPMASGQHPSRSGGER
jgi:hypothetical protein